MARAKTVQIKMMNGDLWYVPEEEFSSFGTPEDPYSVISNYIRGSRGPLLKVNSLADMTGTESQVNGNLILEVTVTYA